ncbi:aldehyde ferredoxin oxidoreductase family protein [Chloroflexota bacterium]
MVKVYGWTGKILRVDLTTGKITEVPTSDYTEKFIGGQGICAKVAWDELPPEVGALDPENKLIIMTGPMGGTVVPSASRVSIGCISPMTYPAEDYIRSNFGGHWGAELKFAGYDGIIVQGKANKPVWLWINDGKVELRDASAYWGQDQYSTQQAIQHDMGSNKIQVLVIGQAGENLVRFAVIGTDNGSIAGRGGTGAVMGSKNLKAIAVRGTGSVEVARPDELYEYSLYIRRQIYRSDARPPYGLYNYGGHRLGHGTLDPVEAPLKESLMKDTLKARACYGCPYACRPFWSVSDGIKPGLSNICSAVMGITRDADLKSHGKYTSAYVKAFGIIDALGMDCMEMKRLVDWLEGCYKEGLLSPKDTGISLDDLGEYECAERMSKMIAFREGFGDKIAEGAHRAAEALGNLGKEFIDEINRGFDPAYHPRIYPTSALFAACDSSHRKEYYHTWSCRTMRFHPQDPGGVVALEEWVNVLKEIYGRDDIIDHTGDAYYAPDKGLLAKWTEDYKTAASGALELCDWIYPRWYSWYSEKPNRRGYTPEAEAKLFSLTTGIDMDVKELLKVGERIKGGLERAIMVREGRRREHDTLSDKWFTEPRVDYPAPGPDGAFVPVTRTLDRGKFEKLKDAYYMERGWDLKTGIPTRAKLEELDLKDVADALGV